MCANRWRGCDSNVWCTGRSAWAEFSLMKSLSCRSQQVLWICFYWVFLNAVGILDSVLIMYRVGDFLAMIVSLIVKAMQVCNWDMIFFFMCMSWVWLDFGGSLSVNILLYIKQMCQKGLIQLCQNIEVDRGTPSAPLVGLLFVLVCGPYYVIFSLTGCPHWKVRWMLSSTVLRQPKCYHKVQSSKYSFTF